MNRFDDWLLGPAPPERLGALRIATGAFVVVYVVANVGEFARLAGRPSAPFEPVGVATMLSGPLAAGALWLLFAALIVTGLAFVAGVWFRVVGVVFAALVLFWSSYHSSWGQMLHFEHLFTLHVMVLAFSPAAAAWSVDSRRNEQAPERLATRYGWPIRIMAIIPALTYAIAAITKLRRSGLSWLDGT